MLLSALSLACLLALHVGKAGMCDESAKAIAQPALTGNNYVIDYFQGFTFAYAIGQCTATGIFGPYAIFKCVNSDTISLSTYSDSSCQTLTGSYSNYYVSGTSYGGKVGTFKCDGNDNYAEVQVSVTSGCSGAVTVFAGLGACATETTLLASQVYCDSDFGLVQFYTPFAVPTTMAPFSSSMEEMSSSMVESESTESEWTTQAPVWTSSMEPSSSMMEEESTMFESTMVTEMSTSAGPFGSPVCDQALICTAWQFAASESCALSGLLTIGGTKHPLYGKMLMCELNAKKKSASSLLAVTNLIVALAVALFSLF